MHKVRITAKAKETENHIVVSLSQPPQLILEGTVLTDYWVDSAACETPGRTAAVIPPEADMVQNWAFRGWPCLEHVRFGKKPLRLGAGVFADCTSLETAVLAEGTDRIPLSAFHRCSSLRQVILPDTVTRINMNAFKNCAALKNLDFPTSLEVIELSAFWGCRNLEEVRLPDSLKELGDDAFGNCTGLRKAELPESLEEIGICAFLNCVSLEEIVIPAGVKRLPLGVFAGCKSLRRVVLPGTLEFVSRYAFYRCDNLEIVEHPAPEQIAPALWNTPFWRQRHPEERPEKRLPMELLNQISGEISGCMLSAMGYHGFDLDRNYRFFTTEYPGVIEVRSRYREEPLEDYRNDFLLMTEALEPIPGIQPLLGLSDRNMGLSESVCSVQKWQASSKLKKERRE